MKANLTKKEHLKLWAKIIYHVLGITTLVVGIGLIGFVFLVQMILKIVIVIYEFNIPLAIIEFIICMNGLLYGILQLTKLPSKLAIKKRNQNEFN